MHRCCLTSTVRTVLIAGLLFSQPSGLLAQTAPDNTKVNTRDRAKGAVTADQQKENDEDRGITQKIRRALVENKSLSSYAHNVKIITQGGHVTLKGPVRSDEEKRTVAAKALEIAGEGHVTNEMSVAPLSTKPKK